MKKLPSQAAFSRRVRMGVYVAAQCSRAHRTELAQKVEAVSAAVKTAGRAWEDSEEQTTRAIALKKAADWDLDSCAQDIRFVMASASRNAVNEVPYTRVWHSGIDYYTGARESDQVAVYTELITLLSTWLAEADPLRTQAMPRLQTLLEEWQKVAAGVSEAETRESQARLTLEDNQAEFDRVMDEIYGTLFAELGRRGADRHFP